MATNSSPLLSRFIQYQAERFPFLAHGLLISIFSFSAVAYSRLCRGLTGFIEWPIFLTGIFITITLFFLVRIFDEHKDAEDDAQFRKSLPVPRGLITLNELRNIGIFVFFLQILIQWWRIPTMIPAFLLVFGYLCLMGKEFFVVEWLKKHQFWYVTSHMFIIPLVDIYASGLDWLMDGASPPKGLIFFFIVSYFNGIVLEIGRKIRTPEQEEPGVLSYTAQLGTQRAIYYWLGILILTLISAIVAASYTGSGTGTYLFLGGIFTVAATPAVLFLRQPSAKSAKWIEYASALWTASMYLSLGGVPMLRALLAS